MNYKHHLQADKLEKYSFWWSQARLAIAALSLLTGAIPIVVRVFFSSSFMFSSFGMIGGLLNLSWIISGLASGYLLYRWFKGGQKLFGGSDKRDMIAFLISVVSGINLGLAGITGNNIGLSIFRGWLFWTIAAVVYIMALWHLHRRFKAHGDRLF